MGFVISVLENSYLIFIHRFLPVQRPDFFFYIIRADGRSSVALCYLRASRFYWSGIGSKDQFQNSLLFNGSSLQVEK